MKNRFKNWTLEHPTTSMIVVAAIAAIALFGVIVAIEVFYFQPRTPALNFFELNANSGEVELRTLYKDGHWEVTQSFTETTDGYTLLGDPLYAGCAPRATSYDPAALYEACKAGNAPPFFEYNYGKKFGDWGLVKYEPMTAIMIVQFHNGVISWVDANGVIASATVVNDEPQVVFYRDSGDSKPLL